MTQVLQQQQHFEQLTRPWRDRLFGVALRRAGTRAWAEDWIQETLLRAWRDFHSLSDNVAVYAWLLKILDHVIADDTRRNARRHQLAPVVSTQDDVLTALHCAAPGPFEQTLQHQTDQQMTAAIQSLPDEFCTVVLLRDIEGLSYQEIATVLDIPQGTVMSRLSRGRRLLATIVIKQQTAGNQTQDSRGNHK